MKTKKLLSIITSIVLSLALMVGFVFAPATTVSAAITEQDTLSAGDTETYTFTGIEKYITLDIDETAFYQLSITDSNSGLKYETAFVIADYDNRRYVLSEEMALTSTYNSEPTVLFEGGNYVLGLAYLEYDESDEPSSCELVVTLTKSDNDFDALSASEKSFDFEANKTYWFEFTTTTAGDYTMNYDSFSAFIYVFDFETGLRIDSRDTEYWDYSLGDWVAGEKTIFSLDENTKYLFAIDLYCDDPVTASMSITANGTNKTVKDISLFELAYEVTSYTFINESTFKYEVTYNDNSTVVLSYAELCQSGIDIPEIIVRDDEIEVNGYYLNEGGITPIVLESRYGSKVYYVNVESMTDRLISEGLRATDEYDECSIEYESDDEYTYWWRIKVSETGYYGIWRYDEDDFSTNFEFYNIEIIDEYNHIVQYNESINGWPLVKDREYALSFNYQYDDSHTYNDIEFWLQKDSQRMYSDVSSGDWFNDAVTYAGGRGIMSGYGGTSKFGSADGIQRQDFLVMLARLDGVSLHNYEYDSEFPDVPHGSYYEAAINWGYEAGIVSGYQNGNFGVGDKITREQIVTFLYRYANYSFADTYSSINENTLKNQYADYAYVNDYAKEPMLWAIDKGVIKGKTSNTIVPYGNALRCEIAQIMYNIYVNDII